MAYQYYTQPGSSRGGAAAVANLQQPDSDLMMMHQHLNLQQLQSQDNPRGNNYTSAHLNHSSGYNVSTRQSEHLTGWIDTMIEELSGTSAMEPPPQPPQLPPSSQHPQSRSGKIINNDPEGASSSRDSSSLETGSPPPHYALHHHSSPDALVAQQQQQQEDIAVQLVHSLLACAEAIEREDRHLAEKTLHRIQLLGLPPGPMGKVAAHFIDALTRRVYPTIATTDEYSTPLSELLHFHFYQTCPYLKFAHFTANQAILDAFEGHDYVHVIDFNLMHGLQWPSLIQALALRPGGPPHLRLTGIGPPQLTGTDVLQEIGKKLHLFADKVKLVHFEFRGVVAAKLDDIKPWMLELRQNEAVAVNSILQLHKLIYSTSPSSPPPVDDLLRSVRALKPRIFTVVEQEANHNHGSFLARFTEALFYYSTMFDSMEGTCQGTRQSVNEQVFAEMYLGREIVNIVACEEAARTERHERLPQWRSRLVKAGYRPVRLGMRALSMFSSSEGYQVEETMQGCLTLGWRSRPLIAASAWQYCP